MKHTFFIISLFLFSFSLLQGQTGVEDSFWDTPRGTYEQRKKDLLEYQIREGPKTERLGIFRQIARIEAGLHPEENYVQEAANDIYRNRDCNDFTVNGLLRLTYMNKQKPVLSDQALKSIESCLLDFKYWWDDGRRDTTYRCYHTENHQALYHTAELLAGQLYKDKIFTNGMTGREHMQHAKERLKRWLEFRFRFGFSEWLSSYYDVEVMLLTNLYDYAEDPQIRFRAGLLLDMLFFDMALNNYHGRLGSSSGRIYVRSLIYGEHELSGLLKLVFGEGKYNSTGIMGTVCLAASTYRCPEIIREIATDYSKKMFNKQRIGLNVEEAPRYGFSYENELDIHFFWGMQEFIHPEVVRMSKRLSEKYDTWPYRNYDHYIKIYEDQIKRSGKVTTPWLDRFALSEANIISYRTPDYMLSCVLDYRPQAQGYQQHIWQATIDRETLVFTTAPGSTELKVCPNYWAGNASMPRAVQYGQTVICMYDIPEKEKLGFTHAYFPKADFDEVTEKNGWVLARKKDTYIALYSHLPTEWKTDEKGIYNDLVAQGRKNTWICELGSKEQWGSFPEFTNAILSSRTACTETSVFFQSPSSGAMEFAQTSEFKVNGQPVPLRNEYRYDNPYCKSKFDTRRITIQKEEKKLTLDFDARPSD